MNTKEIKPNMKIIQVTDEVYEFLMNLSEELNSQNHRCTAMPYIFQIQTKEEVPSVPGNGNKAWYFDGSKIESEDEISQAISEIKGIPMNEVTDSWWEREQILRDAGWNEFEYEEKEKLENAFLTSKACDEHIRANRHHYNKPVNYLSHAFRNPELEKLMSFICSLTGKTIHK